MGSDKMRDEFEEWITADAARENRVIRIVRERNWYAGRHKHHLNTSWSAWQASYEALLKNQLREQEEFLAHLADFEPEDALHG
ncbi:hypothetical protein [Pseudomonas coleopterorum]|uniref:hypothetical protein n=1 Tax=Pseudomonas coleopterorum TaxID=1605838 RepID=UPI0008976693|nr:hypothetical protein [Pseudomonas coleopterorum]SEE39454.1 hypothetical protein SAMN05216510_2450 [Pseudomonas coleopterorum]